MNRQLKVFVMPMKKLAEVYRHEALPINFPADAEILHFHEIEPARCATICAVLVHSKQYPDAPIGMPLPVVTAVFSAGEKA